MESFKVEEIELLDINRHLLLRTKSIDLVPRWGDREVLVTLNFIPLHAQAEGNPLRWTQDFQLILGVIIASLDLLELHALPILEIDVDHHGLRVDLDSRVVVVEGDNLPARFADPTIDVIIILKDLHLTSRRHEFFFLM